MYFTKFAVVGATALLALFIFIGCESDADKIRDINESLRSPTSTATKQLEATIDALDLQEGDCIISTLPEEITIETVVIVPCNEEWQYRVLNSFEAFGESYPSDVEFQRQAEVNCDRRYTFILFPEEEAWSSIFWADRSVDCLQESFGLSLIDPAKLDRLVSKNSLQIGECLNDAPETDDSLIELVSCDSIWQYRVLNSFEAIGTHYPSDFDFQRQAFNKCARHWTKMFFPQEEDWSSPIMPYRKVTCIQESFGLSVVDPGKLDRLVGWDSLQTGECLNEAPETDDLQVEVVPCDREWEYRVLNSFTVDSSIFPSDMELYSQAYAYCDPRYTFALFPQEIWPEWRVTCLQESFGLSTKDPAKLDRLVSLESLEAGQCFTEAPETSDLQVEMVDCSEHWDYQVVNIISVPPSSTYPGDSYFQERADRDCYSSSDTYFSPTAETWEIGDHQILCAKSN